METEPYEAAIADLAHSIGLLVRRMRAAAASQELSLTEAAVLARLAKHGPATISELARGESMKPQSMGATIASLEELGVVARKPHPTDGRQVHVELTEKGRSMRETVRDAKRTWLAHAVARLERCDREALFEAGEILKRLAES